MTGEDSAAARVRARLARPGVLWDEAAMAADIAALTPFERGAILAEDWHRVGILPGGSGDHRRDFALGEILRGTGEDAPVPIFTPEMAAPVIRVLRDLPESPTATLPNVPAADQERHWKSMIRARLSRIFCGLATPFGPAELAMLHPVEALLVRIDPDVRLIAARALGDDGLAAPVRAALRKRLDGPLAQEEFDAVLSAPDFALLRAGLALLQPGGALARMSTGKDDEALADIPAWRRFAPAAIATALARVEAVQAGQVPYKADGLMTVDEAQTVARAMGLALEERDADGLAALPRLWMGAAVAPDAKARTMPSQSLTIALGHIAVKRPAPEALQALRAVAGAVRHAGVKKKLDRMLPAARTALRQQPERLLDLAMQGPLERDVVKLLKPALEGLLTRTADMPADLWQAQMTGADLWPLASALIWEVDGQARLPQRAGRSLLWQDAADGTAAFAPDQRIRLWHPAEASEAERAQWRRAILAGDHAQPFAQAFREVYALPPEEAETGESALFAGHVIAQIPAFGLLRRSGWRVSLGEQLSIRLGGRRFEFDPGIRLYPGAGGIGVTGAFRIAGPERRFADLPPRLLSEALRAVDLLVTVGVAGVPDTERVTHWSGRRLWPGSTSLQMRAACLQLARPEARIEGRWLLLAGGLRISLATGRIDADGTTLPLPSPARSRATARADDPVMDLVWAAVAAYGLETG